MKKLTLILVLIASAINIICAQDVEPLIKTHWNQIAPYNNLCPKDSTGRRMMAGCGPIAMAQVVNYLGVRNDSLQLIRDCGVSAFTRYGVDASSSYTYLCANALKKQFGLSNYINVVNYKSLSGIKEFADIVFNEIRQGRPVIISAKRDDNDSGHLFILDGIKGNCVHANMGWGGDRDGYYSLENIAGYVQIQDAIVDISAADYVPDQAIVRVYKPGALRALMIKNGIQKKPHLKIEGSINKNDVAWLHQLSMYDDLNKRYGSIKTLDLSNTDMTYLPDSSFFNSGSLAYIKLPHNLHTIGLAAFKESICLNNVDIPSSVRNIRMDAFARCGNLLDITIPEGVHKVLSGSFFGCVFLTDVKLPSTIDTIGYYAFANCYRLTRLQIPAATKLIGPKITTGDRNVEIVIDPNNAYFYAKNGAIYRREDNKSIDVPIKYKGDLKPNPYQHLYEDGYAYKTTYKIVNGKKVKLKTVRYKIKQ